MATNHFKVVNEAPTQVVIEIKRVIIDHMDKLKQNKKDLKNAKELIQNSVQNSEKYREAVKEEEKHKREKKAEILRVQADNPELMNKIDDLAKEGKELKSALSDYLNEYVRLSGDTDIEVNGEKYPIKRTATVQLKLL